MQRVVLHNFSNWPILIDEIRTNQLDIWSISNFLASIKPEIVITKPSGVKIEWKGNFL